MYIQWGSHACSIWLNAVRTQAIRPVNYSHIPRHVFRWQRWHGKTFYIASSIQYYIAVQHGAWSNTVTLTDLITDSNGSGNIALGHLSNHVLHRSQFRPRLHFQQVRWNWLVHHSAWFPPVCTIFKSVCQSYRPNVEHYRPTVHAKSICAILFASSWHNLEVIINKLGRTYNDNNYSMTRDVQKPSHKVNIESLMHVTKCELI